MNRLFNESVIRQCKAALLPTLLTMGLTCGGEVFAATAAASPTDRQVAMTTSAGPAYSAIKLGYNVFGSCLNAGGQVAFNVSLSGPAYFYNGARFQNIGTLGGSSALALALNDYGHVVGISETAGRGSSTLFSRTPMKGTPGVSASNRNTCGLGSWSSISSKGQLAGTTFTAGRVGDDSSHAFLWTPTKGMVDIGTFNGVNPNPVAINNVGQVIATSTDNANSLRGYFWSATDGTIDLGSASGVRAFPAAINNAGQVAGSASPSPGRSYAFLWTKGGGLVNLGGLGSYINANATAINNKGQVVGSSYNASPYFHAFSWTQEDGMIDLGEVGPGFSPAVNDLGQVMLESTIWTRSGSYWDFGSLGGNYTVAAAMNSLGQVVGASTTVGQPSSLTHAFVWTSTGGMVDLNTADLPAGTTLRQAIAISDNGLILAKGDDYDVYLLVPYTRRITSPQSESFLQRSPFQRLAPGTLLFP